MVYRKVNVNVMRGVPVMGKTTLFSGDNNIICNASFHKKNSFMV